MRKRIIAQTPRDDMPKGEGWLDLESMAQVDLTSEDSAYPIESALKPGVGLGWRASGPGRQTLRFLFDKPTTVNMIHIVFNETNQARTQEFVLRWSSDRSRTFKEIVRQQYTFSPPENILEKEEYDVNLVGLTELEIVITPEISGGPAQASIAELRLA